MKSKSNIKNKTFGYIWTIQWVFTINKQNTSLMFLEVVWELDLQNKEKW